MGRKERVIIGVMAFLGVAVILFLLLQKGGERVSRPVPTAPTAVARPIPVYTIAPQQEKFLPAKLIAVNTISFLDKQRREDGFYDYYAYYNEVCPVDTKLDSCRLGPINVFETANMWSVLGRLSYYRNFSNDPHDLSQAEKDAQKLINYCREDLTKCVVTLFPLMQLYELTENDEYRQFILDVGELLSAGKVYARDISSLGMQARELAKLYEVFDEERYLVRAQRFLTEAEEAVASYQERYGKLNGEVCYVTLAQAEIGRAAKDSAILGKAAQFLKDGKEKDVSKELTLIQPCVESAFILGETLNDENLKTKAASLLDELVVERWDGPTLGKRYQSGGFFLGGDKDVITVTDAGYMLYLMGFDPNKTYSLSHGL